MKSCIFTFLTVSATLVACTSTKQTGYSKSEVVERIASKKETPDWANGELPMSEENGDVVFANILTMSGNSRPEACMKAAEMDARSQMLRHIKDNLVSSGQLNEVSATQDPGYESLTAFFSSGKIVGAKIGARYWERALESDESGTRVLRLRCATKVSVKKSELIRQMREASGVPTGDPKVREALNKATNNFIDGLNQSESKND